MIYKTFQEDLEVQIEHQLDNNFAGHARTVLGFSFGVSGKVLDGEFALWRYSFLYGAFYCVVEGTIQQTENKLHFTAKAQLNKFGSFIAHSLLISLIGLLIYASTTWNFGSFKDVIVFGLISLSFIGIPIFLFRLILVKSKRDALDLFKELVNSIQNGDDD